jgi:hypothetical protein
MRQQRPIGWVRRATPEQSDDSGPRSDPALGKSNCAGMPVIKSRTKVIQMSETTPIKEEARRLVEELPDNATWSDFARLVIERQRIEEGIADLDAGITWTSDEIRGKLGIPK